MGAGYASDLKWVESSAREIAKFSKNHTIVVEKSTLPVKTAETIKNILYSATNVIEESGNKNKAEKKTYSIISNPEFLAEGSAINDLQNPDRDKIAGDDQKAIQSLSNNYSKCVPKEKV